MPMRSQVIRKEQVMSLIRKFLKRFTRKSDKAQLKKLKQVIPETPPPQLQIKTVEDARAVSQIRTFRAVRAFCEEVRKTLIIYKKSCQQMVDISWTHKKAIDSLYVEMGNLANKIDKIERLIESQKKNGISGRKEE